MSTAQFWDTFLFGPEATGQVVGALPSKLSIFVTAFKLESLLPQCQSFPWHAHHNKCMPDISNSVVRLADPTAIQSNCTQQHPFTSFPCPNVPPSRPPICTALHPPPSTAHLRRRSQPQPLPPSERSPRVPCPGAHAHLRRPGKGADPAADTGRWVRCALQ